MTRPGVGAATAAALLLWALAAPSIAAHSAIDDDMLASVVFVGCEVQYHGDTLLAGWGSGFLVANSEYVITNNHVVGDCQSDNKIEVLKTALQKAYVQAISQGNLPPSIEEELRQNPAFVERLKSDPELLRKYLSDRIDKLSNLKAKADSSSITQKLYIAYMGKEGATSVKVDVSNIAWASWTSDDRAHQTGVDVAILKLTRALTSRPSVSFATGSSAQVNDEVYTVGFPGASSELVPSAKYVPTMKRGIVSKLGGESPFASDVATSRGWKGAPVIETDAAISSGNSGGPLYNEYGEVLGINTFGPKSNTPGIGWAQDIAVVIPVMKDLGLPLPHIATAPRGWIDKNAVLVRVALGGGGVLLLLLGTMLFLQRRNAGASAGRSGRREAPVGPRPATRVGVGVVGGASVKARRGEYAGRVFQIPAGGLVFGRDQAGSGGVAFGDDSDISRRHCSIAYDARARRFAVTDLGSANGTFVMPAGTRLAPNQAMVCKSGQVIRLGQKNEFELAAD